MLEVKVPQDIRKHEDRMFLGLSTKQLGVMAVTVGASLVAYFITKNIDSVAYVAITVAFLGFSNITSRLSPLLKFIKQPKTYTFIKTFDLYQYLLDEEVGNGISEQEGTETTHEEAVQAGTEA